MANTIKKLPKFPNEQAERNFWKSHDSTDHVDWSKAKRGVFPNLKPSTRTISLRMTESMFSKLKTEANKRDIPYQSYLKVLVDNGLKINSQQKSR